MVPSEYIPMILSSDNVSTLETTAVDTTPASTGLQQVPPTLDPGKANSSLRNELLCQLFWALR